MSVIAEKYGMSDEKFKKAINDGLISTSWLRREEIVVHFKEKLKGAKNKSEAVKLTAESFNCTTTYIHTILREDVFR